MDSSDVVSEQPAPCLGVAFVGPSNPEDFRVNAEAVLRPLRLRATPPSASDQTSGEVRAFEPFRQEDIERALEGASAVVIGLPVPIPAAAVTQEHERDAQSFIVDGLIAAAHARGINHIAVVSPSRSEASDKSRSFFDEVGRIVRAYGMDVLDVPKNDAPNVKEAVARWINRCAKRTSLRAGAAIRPQDLLTRKPAARRTMRSLQRLSLPKGWDADRLARAYPAWLGDAFPFLLRVDVDDDGSFRIVPTFSNEPLLELAAVPRLNGARRRVFAVRGGKLASDHGPRTGWLEFRVLPGGKEAIAAVVDYVPRLPFPVYRMTQAPAHRLVMEGFDRYLQRVKPSP